MKKLKETDINHIIEYIIVSICIFCSGAVAYQNNHKIILVICTILMGILFFLKKEKKKLKVNYYITLFVIFYIITSIYHLINSSTNFFGEMGILTQFILSILICILITPKKFIYKYNKIIYFLGITSLIMYVIPMIFPRFTSIFPIVQDYAGSKFYNAGIYCYPTYIVKSYYRNQSIFWECGAFQAFLNMALFFELYIKRYTNKKHILVYIIAILTTRSTTGYIILLLLVFTKIVQMIKLEKKHLKTMLILGICLTPIVPLIGTIIIKKFVPGSATYISFLRRYYDNVLDFKIIFGNIGNFLFGVGEEKYIHIFSNLLNNVGIGTFSNISSSSNSITAFIAQHGVISSVPICIIYLKGIFSRKQIITRIIFLFMILVLLATENLVMAPIFLVSMIQLEKYQKKCKEKSYEKN